jgi:hypothetical protein
VLVIPPPLIEYQYPPSLDVRPLPLWMKVAAGLVFLAVAGVLLLAALDLVGVRPGFSADALEMTFLVGFTLAVAAVEFITVRLRSRVAAGIVGAIVLLSMCDLLFAMAWFASLSPGNVSTAAQVITWIGAVVLLYIAVCHFAFIAWAGGRSRPGL